ncbi:MAG: hypothetical protein ACKO6F_00725 [Cyanobium sp.]
MMTGRHRDGGVQTDHRGALCSCLLKELAILWNCSQQIGLDQRVIEGNCIGLKIYSMWHETGLLLSAYASAYPIQWAVLAVVTQAGWSADLRLQITAVVSSLIDGSKGLCGSA